MQWWKRCLFWLAPPRTALKIDYRSACNDPLRGFEASPSGCNAGANWQSLSWPAMNYEPIIHGCRCGIYAAFIRSFFSCVRAIQVRKAELRWLRIVSRLVGASQNKILDLYTNWINVRTWNRRVNNWTELEVNAITRIENPLKWRFALFICEFIELCILFLFLFFFFFVFKCIKIQSAVY